MLREDNRLIPATHIDCARAAGNDAAEKSKAYVRRHWRYAQTGAPARAASASAREDALWERIQTHTLCISGMAFQDAWNIDRQRLERCCIHVVSADLQLIPFCAYYLTDSRGRRFLNRCAGQS